MEREEKGRERERESKAKVKGSKIFLRGENDKRPAM